MREPEVRARVEALLADLLGADELIVDDDGDVPVRWGSAIFYVRVIDGEPSIVRIFSPMLQGVKASKRLFRAINDINSQVVTGRMFWLDNDILVCAEIVGDHLDRAELEHACHAVATISDAFDDELQREHGGTRAFEDDGRALRGF